MKMAQELIDSLKRGYKRKFLDEDSDSLSESESTKKYSKKQKPQRQQQKQQQQQQPKEVVVNSDTSGSENDRNNSDSDDEINSTIQSNESSSDESKIIATNSKAVGEKKKLQKVQINKLKKPNNLFEEKTPIYSNKNIKIFVVKDYLKRQKIFKFVDHLYTIKIEVIKGRPPLLSSILDALRKAIDFCLKAMKTNYKAGNLKLFII